MYLEEVKTPWITEIVDNRLGWDSDLEDRPADLYLKL